MSVSAVNPRKRKRRGAIPRPVAAQLVLDNRLEEDIGLVSEDLFDELCFTSDGKERGNETTGYIAIAPQYPGSSPKHESWTLVAVRSSASALSNFEITTPRSIHVPAFSVAGRIVYDALVTRSKQSGRPLTKSPFEIRAAEVMPIALETVVVNIPQVSGHKKGQNVRLDDETAEKNLADELQKCRLVYTGQPVALNGKDDRSASITICQPVDQGYVTKSTRLVITREGTKIGRAGSAPSRPTRSLPPAVLEDDGEDTSNEQFFSAAEGPVDSPARTVKKARLPSVSVETSGSSGSSDEDESETDLSEDDTSGIGLSLPSLPASSCSAYDGTTPRNGLLGNGIATPGSVISSFSTATVTASGLKGKIFQVKQLIAPVPEESLQPPPAGDEDNEARVFIDSSSLAKIGCFSGDWVSLEVVSDDPFSSLGSTHANHARHDSVRRVAKVYAIQIADKERPRYTIDRGGRRTSTSSFNSTTRSPLVVYISPITYANLSSAPSLRITPIPAPPSTAALRPGRQQHRMSTSLTPPPAKEVSLIKLATPLATERELQDAILQQLKEWFQGRKRLVMEGDLVPLSIDRDMGKALFRGSAPDTEGEQQANGHNVAPDSNHVNVVWFKVCSVLKSSATEDRDYEHGDELDPWAGMATVNVTSNTTRMTQSGSEEMRTPSGLANQWQYYMGVKKHSFGEEIIPDCTQNAPEYISTMRRRIRELISAATSPQAVHFSLPPVAILMISTQRHIGKATTVEKACVDLGMHIFDIDSYDILNEDGSGGSDTKTVATLEARAERAMTCGAQHTALLVRHIDVLSSDRVVNTLQHILSTVRILIATTTSIDKVPEGIRALFTHELEMNAPDETEREGLLRTITASSSIPLSPSVSLSNIALKTAALVAGDLVDVVSRAQVARQSRLEGLARSTNTRIPDILRAGGTTATCLLPADFTSAIESTRKTFSSSIGAPKIPSVTWSDIGGLSSTKSSILETIQLPLQRPELFASGLKKRSGMLFYGPPGTGKTLLAKAIATEFSLNFFSIKGPELLNMYIGESEANVRRVFQRARDAKPCVVFFDELDSVAPKRGNQGDSGGVMDRIVSQLLAELDGMSGGDGGGQGVFVIGATNRPDLLDQALLRPGRFDKMLYLGVSDTNEKQRNILEALTRKFKLAPGVDLGHVVSKLPFTYTGADMYALASDAMLKAITRKANGVDEKVKALNEVRAKESPPSPPRTVAWFFDHEAGPQDIEVVVDEEDFEAARREMVPSVSVKELEHYERVRKTFEEGGDAAKDEKKQQKIPQRLMPLMSKAVGKRTDEDIVAATEALSLNGHANGVYGSSASAKGKGKAVLRPDDEMNGFGDATNGDADLY